MPKILFPDGRTQSFEKEINGFVIAESISKSLLKKAVAISVNGKQKDLCDMITEDAEINIITKDSDEGLEIMRHTLTAQVLAKAIKTIYPKAKLAIGPTIENGFYYDVLFEKPISIDDFPAIEKEMNNIIKKGSQIEKSYKDKKQVKELFDSKKEIYKVKIINESEQEKDFQIYEQKDSNFLICAEDHIFQV